MRVALIHKDIGIEDRGGVSMLYKTLAKQLLISGIEVIVISQRESFSDQIKWIKLPMEGDPFSYSKIVSDTLGHLNVDVAECSSWRFELLDFLKKRRSSTKIISRCDPTTATLFGSGHKYVEFEKEMIEKSDYSIAVSEFARKDISAQYQINVSEVIFNGLDLSNIAGAKNISWQDLALKIPRLKLPKGDQKTLVWIGKRTLMKGFDYFQDFLATVKDANLNIIFIEGHVINPIPWRKGLAQRVNILSNLNREYLFAIMKNSDAGIIFSRQEGFSYCFAEMHCLGVQLFCNQQCEVIREFQCDKDVTYFDPRKMLDLFYKIKHSVKKDRQVPIVSIDSKRMLQKTLIAYRRVLNNA